MNQERELLEALAECLAALTQLSETSLTGKANTIMRDYGIKAMRRTERILAPQSGAWNESTGKITKVIQWVKQERAKENIFQTEEAWSYVPCAVISWLCELIDELKAAKVAANHAYQWINDRREVAEFVPVLCELGKVLGKQ